MRQIAWLDFHGGCWAFGYQRCPRSRSEWANRDLALSDLTWKGGTIDEPHGKQPTMSHESNRHFYGYGLEENGSLTGIDANLYHWLKRHKLQDIQEEY